MRKNESAYSRELIKILNESGDFYVWKNHGSRFGQNGVADIIGVEKTCGTFIAIEMKIVRTKSFSFGNIILLCTPLQLAFLKKVEANNGMSIGMGIHVSTKKIILIFYSKQDSCIHELEYKDRKLLPIKIKEMISTRYA